MANPFYDDPETVRLWRERRRHHVGASEAAAVCGLSPWQTALGVWLDKTAPDDTPPGPTERMRWGHLLEPAIARGYELATGVRLLVPDMAVHPQFPFMAASADRVRPVGGFPDGGRLVQLKNVGRASDEWGEPGTDEVPRAILLQCQQEMAVYGFDLCDVAALFGGNELRIYTVSLNLQLIEDLAGILGAFWKLVETRTPPEPDWLHPTTPALLDRLCRPRAGVEVELAGVEHERNAEDYRDIGEHIKSCEADRRELKARLVHAMGDASRARCGKYTLRRLEVQRKGYTVEPATYTDFRVAAPKPLETDE